MSYRMQAGLKPCATRLRAASIASTFAHGVTADRWARQASRIATAGLTTAD
jgi:hypothetical protein